MEPSEKTPIDPETGFPALPQGYVWQIFRNETGNGSGMNVYISFEEVKKYQKKVREGWFKYSTEWVTYSTYHVVPGCKEFVRTTDYLSHRMDGMWRSFMHDRQEQVKIEKLCGTYPPKKFN